MATKVNAKDFCPGCGGMWSMIGRAHLCSGRLLQEVPRAEAEPKTRVRAGRTAGLIPATGASPKEGHKKQVYLNTDERRAYMREYMRNKRNSNKNGESK